MGIREQGYRHWEGQYTGHSFRWWSITKATLRSTVYTKGRLFLLLVLAGVAWIFPFFFGVFYFFGEITSRAQPPDQLLRSNLFEMIVNWQWMWGVIFSAVIGSRLVANDLRSDALYIYLAKPLRRIDYIIGKLLACLVWLVPVTLMPALWVYLAATGSATKVLPFRESGEIFWEIMGVYATFMLTCSACAVAISSFTKRWTIALIGWIGAVFLTIPIAAITAGATRKPEWQYVSPANDLWIFAEHMWEQPVNPTSTPDWAPAFWILIGMAVLAIAVFSVRIARLEVSE